MQTEEEEEGEKKELPHSGYPDFNRAVAAGMNINTGKKTWHTVKLRNERFTFIQRKKKTHTHNLHKHNKKSTKKSIFLGVCERVQSGVVRRSAEVCVCS